MKIYSYLIYFLLLIITVSCYENKNADVEDSIKNLIKKFPQLKSSSKTFENDYKLVKSVKNGQFDFEIQLFSEPDSIQGRQKIIVFINSKKECYSIPFFSNKYKDYWGFPFDKQIPNVQKVNSTFTNELNNVLYKLTEYKNPKKEVIDYEITEELLYSVLNCKNLEERDSTLVYKKIHMNLDIPEENSDSAFIRLKNNYELMKKDWHPREYVTNYNCYLDEKNARIYQFKFNKSKKQIKIQTYRQDYGFRYIYL
jgi:hypothetical protein